MRLSKVSVTEERKRRQGRGNRRERKGEIITENIIRARMDGTMYRDDGK